jgi:2-oxo-4-hydroxy-4-carboxy--5-ureidoimidazoline (OHCU) decarboxylase
LEISGGSLLNHHEVYESISEEQAAIGLDELCSSNLE